MILSPKLRLTKFPDHSMFQICHWLLLHSTSAASPWTLGTVLGATIYERYKTISIQTRATKGEEGSGGQDVWGVADVICSVQPRAEEAEGGPHVSLQLLMRGARGQRWALLSVTATGPEEMRKVMLGSEKRFFTKGWVDTGTGSAGQWSQPQASRDQQAFGQCFQKCGLILGGFLWGQELDLVILVNAFQLRILYDSVLSLFV